MKMRQAKDSAEIFDLISKLSSEAEWSDEDLKEALWEEGVDSDHLVKQVMTGVKQWLDAPAPKIDSNEESESQSIGEALPLLGMLKNSTGRSAIAIAKSMDVSVAFLSAVARYPTAVPDSWREELAGRAERSLGIDSKAFMESMSRAVPRGIAAFRERHSYSTTEITYKGVLERSGMSSKAKQFWLELATKAKSR
jgi:hypothetical protein